MRHFFYCLYTPGRTVSHASHSYCKHINAHMHDKHTPPSPTATLYIHNKVIINPSRLPEAVFCKIYLYSEITCYQLHSLSLYHLFPVGLPWAGICIFFINCLLVDRLPTVTQLEICSLSFHWKIFT